MWHKQLKINKDSIRNTSILSELYQYRRLIFIIFNRDFKSTYKQTLLGPLWIILNPIMTSLVFTVVFSKIGKISTDQIPPFLFYFSAITIWNLFQNNVMQISNFYNSSADNFKKLYFPRLVVPCSYLINNSIKFLIQISILLILCFFVYDVKNNLNFISIVSIIYVYFYCLLLSFGLGLILNSFTFWYKDINYLIVYGLTISMYLTPIAYPLSQAPLLLREFLVLNPMTSIVELFRYSIFGIGTIDYISILSSIAFLVLFLLVGVFAFTKTEKNFIDNV
jgi:lipopolysaccharide transport system permease protein